ncbi:MAG: hypothetical protein J6B31_06935 [Bacteroidaceae bacterium]|nr:hypothetical protein [Bacteroidaceae bacterium]MBQ8888794.1 hypothetical protein [Bacteroidaceae bacterium]
MKEQIRRIFRQQIGGFIGIWALPLFMAFLFEIGAFPEGLYAGNAQLDYILQSVGILLTIGMIPFALRIFNLNLVKRIKELPLQQALKSYRIWADIRLCLLFVPAILNLQFYYLTLNTTGLFCSVMALIATLFCVPSESRIKNELDLPDEING